MGFAKPAIELNNERCSVSLPRLSSSESLPFAFLHSTCANTQI